MRISTLEMRPFGSSGLKVSVIGFGAWGIGGPMMAGDTPIGWGDVDDAVSVAALERAFERGITLYDTADFYGLGHSEELIGRVFGNRQDVTVATKVGHRLTPGGHIELDYSKQHILSACEASLKRLRRDTIDLYQLHSARLVHLEQGECVDAMELLRAQGKIRAWGLSLNTFQPAPEADYLMERGLGQGFQLVLNIVNQRAVPLLERMQALGYGVIARMPLQFGLLTGKFSTGTLFAENDHRRFRLTPAILEASLPALQRVWDRSDRNPTALSLSYCASYPAVSTVIPGIKTPAQADANTTGIRPLGEQKRCELEEIYDSTFADLVRLMEDPPRSSNR